MNRWSTAERNYNCIMAKKLEFSLNSWMRSEMMKLTILWFIFCLSFLFFVFTFILLWCFVSLLFLFSNSLKSFQEKKVGQDRKKIWYIVKQNDAFKLFVWQSSEYQKNNERNPGMNCYLTIKICQWEKRFIAETLNNKSRPTRQTVFQWVVSAVLVQFKWRRLQYEGCPDS